MGDYVIKMNLEVYNKNNPQDNIGVIYDTNMSEEDSESIDAVEKIFVNLNRQVLKEGISEHLENISKKCQKYQEENCGIIEKNDNEYKVDGEKSLHNAIVNKFSWFKDYGILLDWYHLSEKCKMELSLALKKRDFRNDILEKIEKQLWIGKIDGAIEILRAIAKDNIKSESNIERLIGYFERNRDYIPCYALRKSLGLRNSSNKGEKANDILVASRQKHNGMSWSKDGSVALATISTLYKNNEQKNWQENSKIEFKFVS